MIWVNARSYRVRMRIDGDWCHRSAPSRPLFVLHEICSSTLVDGSPDRCHSSRVTRFWHHSSLSIISNLICRAVKGIEYFSVLEHPLFSDLAFRAHKWKFIVYVVGPYRSISWQHTTRKRKGPGLHHFLSLYNASTFSPTRNVCTPRSVCRNGCVV